MTYGATPSDWTHFDLVLGLTRDLLPVVSNPHAEISPNSKMKAVGKTPSLLNRDGHVVGFPQWTQFETLPYNIEEWSAQPDYGICVQTRHVRALDIDVDDDVALDIETAFLNALGGLELPVRCRSNSQKMLLAFVVEGDLPKRRFLTETGAVEFLATGQQFVAIGTHTSGIRYNWPDGLPTSFPVISAEAFDAAWRVLEERFAVEKIRDRDYAQRRRGADLAIEDPVCDYLYSHNLVLDEGRDGALYVECPWKGEHTSDSGVTETAWYPAGSNGYERGHFKCLHAHCAGRTDSEFKRAVGFDETGFEPIGTEAGEPLRLMPIYERDGKGRIEALVNNLVLATERPDVCGWRIGKDAFRDEVSKADAADDAPQWQPFGDTDYMELRCRLERMGFRPISKENLRDVVHMVAERNQFDTAQEWLSRLVWDGVPRIERFMQTYFGVEDTAYASAVSVYIWTALAGRVHQPGIKADMVPILVGDQGAGKSTGVAAMSPDPMYFREISLADEDDDKARKLRGCLIAELAELQGLHTREAEAIKAFVTRTHENWVPKFREFAVTFPRRCLFIGTTNQDEFLADETGNRRWLPVKVTSVDTDAIRRDCLQLWAEGLVRFLADGVLYREAEALGRDEHDTYMLSDPWESLIREWLKRPEALDGSTPAERNFLQMGDVLSGALGFRAQNITRREQHRAGKVLRKLGYSNKLVKIDGKPVKVWS